MKKVNKILMAVIAILLSLVLISTCTVSGIFAKFVIEKTAEVEVDFKAFGVKLQVKQGSVIQSVANTNSVSISYDAIEMYPGVNQQNVVLFAFTAGETLNVPARLKVSVDVKLNDAFYVSSDEFSSTSTYTSNKAYMPIRFELGSVTNPTNDKYYSGSQTSSWLYEAPDTGVEDKKANAIGKLETRLESAIMDKIASKMAGESAIDSTSGAPFVTKDFAAGDQIFFNASSYRGLGLGFVWEIGNVSSNTNGDKAKNMIETLIADKVQGTDAIKVTFTVSLEQTGT